jgi:hypothetical protein
MSVVIFTTPLHLQCRERDASALMAVLRNRRFLTFWGFWVSSISDLPNVLHAGNHGAGSRPRSPGHGAGAGSGVVTRWHPAVQV